MYMMAVCSLSALWLLFPFEVEGDAFLFESFSLLRASQRKEHLEFCLARERESSYVPEYSARLQGLVAYSP